MDEEFIPILEILDELKKINKNLEKITTKEKVWHWIDEPNCYFKCSECGKHYPHTSIYGAKGYNYCPNCGIKMEKVVS